MKLHRGPMWCFADSTQHVEGASNATKQQQKTMEVCCIYLYALVSVNGSLPLRHLSIYQQFLRDPLELTYPSPRLL